MTYLTRYMTLPSAASTQVEHAPLTGLSYQGNVDSYRKQSDSNVAAVYRSDTTSIEEN